MEDSANCKAQARKVNMSVIKEIAVFLPQFKENTG